MSRECVYIYILTRSLRLDSLVRFHQFRLDLLIQCELTRSLRLDSLVRFHQFRLDSLIQCELTRSLRLDSLVRFHQFRLDSLIQCVFSPHSQRNDSFLKILTANAEWHTKN